MVAITEQILFTLNFFGSGWCIYDVDSLKKQYNSIGEVILSDKHDPESDKVLVMSHITKESECATS